MSDNEERAGSARVAASAREVEEFVAAGGWNQPTRLFALVATAEILRQQPELAAQLDPDSEFTPVAQEELPEGDLAEALGRIAWPDLVQGCALAQEIVVLPPEAESELPDVGGSDGAGTDGAGTDGRDPDEEDLERLRRAAADHPSRTEARLVAAVLRDGEASCVLRLRGVQPPARTPSGDPADGADRASVEGTDEIVEHPDLAPNLVQALRATFQP
ncbi:PPA1309 family protein [Saccharomonospora halophila]|uniref:PPA1309 family protein n=1 Tax=Saccharomonospora halophila TaxID=129922 RepID=UPI00036D0252|nr:PPA1309 family protein [Saccharomonospora halophila]